MSPILVTLSSVHLIEVTLITKTEKEYTQKSLNQKHLWVQEEENKNGNGSDVNKSWILEEEEEVSEGAEKVKVRTEANSQKFCLLKKMNYLKISTKKMKRFIWNSYRQRKRCIQEYQCRQQVIIIIKPPSWLRKKI